MRLQICISMCGRREEFGKFDICFLRFWFRPQGPGGGRVINFTVLIPPILEMLQTKNNNITTGLVVVKTVINV